MRYWIEKFQMKGIEKSTSKSKFFSTGTFAPAFPLRNYSDSQNLLKLLFGLYVQVLAT